MLRLGDYLYGTPPILMPTIPLDRHRKTLREIRVLGDPSQLAAQLRSVNRTAAVVARTIGNQVVRVFCQQELSEKSIGN